MVQRARVFLGPTMPHRHGPACHFVGSAFSCLDRLWSSWFPLRPILIAMNPFKWLPIYGEDVMKQYVNRPYGFLPPHCFREAEDAFQQLERTRQNQAIVICGESGATCRGCLPCMVLPA